VTLKGDGRVTVIFEASYLHNGAKINEETISNNDLDAGNY